MSDDLRVVEASTAQRNTAFAQVFEIWPCGATLEAHLQWRLNSVQHLRATWYVGCIDDQVVCSLGAYPFHFSIHNRTWPGIALGAVHTVEAYRGRGLAARLIEDVERLEHQRGAAASMLFSDIKPGYYARLGYQQCPSHRFAIAVEVAPPTSLQLRRVDTAELTELDAAYRRSVAAAAFWIDRGAEYWAFLSTRDRDRATWWEVVRDDVPMGRVQLQADAKRQVLRLVDYTWRPDVDVDALWANLPGLLADAACAQGCSTVRGWVPRLDLIADFVEPRPNEITMLKPLSDDVAIDDAVCSACDHLREVDHV